MADDQRTQLEDILSHELTKLRRLSGGSPEPLDDSQRKALEALARVWKLLGQRGEEERAPETWSASEINEVMERGAASLPLVPASSPLRRDARVGGEGRRDDEADEAFRDL